MNHWSYETELLQCFMATLEFFVNIPLKTNKMILKFHMNITSFIVVSHDVMKKFIMKFGSL